MTLASLKIGTRITLGSLMIVMMVLGFGVFSWYEMKELNNFTEKLHRHPFTVSNAMASAQTDLTAIDKNLQIVGGSGDNWAELLKEIVSLSKSARSHMALANERFLGDKSKISAALAAMDVFDAAIPQLTEHMEKGDFFGSHTLLTALRTTGSKKALHIVAEVRSDSINIYGKRFVENARKAYETIELLTICAVVSIAALAFMVSFLISRSITSPLAKLQSRMLSLAEGEKMAAVAGQERKDEIGTMAKAVEVFRH